MASAGKFSLVTITSLTQKFAFHRPRIRVKGTICGCWGAMTSLSLEKLPKVKKQWQLMLVQAQPMENSPTLCGRGNRPPIATSTVSLNKAPPSALYASIRNGPSGSV
jgi:hypothetical protein